MGSRLPSPKRPGNRDLGCDVVVVGVAISLATVIRLVARIPTKETQQ